MTTIEPWLREIVRCPACRADLRDDAGPYGPELVCTACGLAYRVEDGIPVLIVAQARPAPK
ncbi:MAG: Trm112 family protein [Actinomycetota bacterium]